MAPALLTLAALVGVAAAGPTRDDVLQRAGDLVFHAWQMGPENRLLPRSCAARPASGQYQSAISPGPRVGLPYAWGGVMGVHEFDLRIATGKAAGSHSWQGTAILPCVAGIDCSGFVSEAWGLASKVGTSALADDALTVAITPKELAPGDVLVRAGSHVVLYIGRNDEGEPLFMESAGASGARLHGGWGYVKGYVPRRFRYMDPAPAHGTRAAPWPAPLPFQDRRRPLAFGPDAIASFQCESGVASTGDFGQALYALTLTRPGRLRVDASGDGPVALRLLSGPSGDRCLVQGDGALASNLGAGDWLVSVAARPDLPVSLTIEVDEDTSAASAPPPAPEPAPPDPAPPDPAPPAAPAARGARGGLLPELLGLLLGAALVWWRRGR